MAILPSEPSTAMLWAAFLCGAYFMGSFSSAIVVCRLMGKPDPRSEGSNNPGATNVLRIAGKPAAALTLIGDILKGIIPLFLAALLLHFQGETLALIGVAAFLGHLFPLFFQFQGGKGVATALGVVTTLSWPTGVGIMLCWLAVFLISRTSSLAAIISWVAAPVITYFFAPQFLFAITFMAVALIYRHKQNIKDLLSGSERSFK